MNYILYPFLLKIIDNLDLNIYIILLFSIIYMFIDDIKEYSKNIINNITNNKKNCVYISYTNNNYTEKYKAIIHKIIQTNNVKEIREISNFGYSDDNKYEEQYSGYEICQKNDFFIEDNIYGRFFTKKQPKVSRNGEDSYIIENILCIYSYYNDVNYLLKWIDICIDNYNKYLTNKICDKQLLLSINYDKKINIDVSNWSSTITFDNSYFPDKENILNQIDFFLNNRSWYEEKGIPYNLGIMLCGEPGCGKTRFIKQLLNKTKRHGIDIKLNDNFDFTELKKIIHNDKIESENDDYIIPQDKRIIIFEDIDSMCSILKKRDDKQNDVEKNELTEIKSLLTDKKEVKKSLKNNNNLSYFLNILDGLNECSGRIIIMTTNHPEYLDPAIIRPGRIDIVIKTKKYSKYDVEQLIKSFWGKNININNNIDNKYTSAELINKFRSCKNYDDLIL
jgi:ATP-dependent Zn protease